MNLGPRPIPDLWRVPILEELGNVTNSRRAIRQAGQAADYPQFHPGSDGAELLAWATELRGAAQKLSLECFSLMKLIHRGWDDPGTPPAPRRPATIDEIADLL